MQKINIIKAETTVEKPTIVHTIEFEIYMSEIPQWENIKNIPAIYNFIYLENDINKVSRTLKFTVEGKSTCMDIDEWDEDKGKYIAITRAQINLHKTLNKFYDKIVNYIYDVSNNIYREKIRHWSKLSGCERHLAKDVLNKKDRKYLGYR